MPPRTPAVSPRTSRCDLTPAPGSPEAQTATPAPEKRGRASLRLCRESGESGPRGPGAGRRASAAGSADAGEPGDLGGGRVPAERLECSVPGGAELLLDSGVERGGAGLHEVPEPVLGYHHVPAGARLPPPHPELGCVREA